MGEWVLDYCAAFSSRTPEEWVRALSIFVLFSALFSVFFFWVGEGG